MDDFNSETDSDYTSYWRDWVSLFYTFSIAPACQRFVWMVLDKEVSMGTRAGHLILVPEQCDRPILSLSSAILLP